VDTQKKRCIKLHFPFLTIFLLVGAIISYLSTEVSSFFVYDRAAIINGEFWRLFTGHLVHFNISHLLYDLSAFSLIGWIVESKGYRYFSFLITLMALAIGIFLIVLKTGMAYYGGISGLACGSLIYLALLGLGDEKPWHLLCCLILFIVPIKFFFEGYLGGSILPYSNHSLPFVTIWEAHVVGSVVATTLFFAQHTKMKRFFWVKKHS